MCAFFCNLVFFFILYAFSPCILALESSQKYARSLLHIHCLIHFKYHMVIRNDGGILLRCSFYNLIKFSCTFNSKLNSLNTECGVSSSQQISFFLHYSVVCVCVELSWALPMLYGFSCYARFELCAAICNVGDITYSREIM